MALFSPIAAAVAIRDKRNTMAYSMLIFSDWDCVCACNCSICTEYAILNFRPKQEAVKVLLEPNARRGKRMVINNDIIHSLEKEYYKVANANRVWNGNGAWVG